MCANELKYQTILLPGGKYSVQFLKSLKEVLLV